MATSTAVPNYLFTAVLRLGLYSRRVSMHSALVWTLAQRRRAYGDEDPGQLACRQAGRAPVIFATQRLWALRPHSRTKQLCSCPFQRASMTALHETFPFLRSKPTSRVNRFSLVLIKSFEAAALEVSSIFECEALNLHISSRYSVGSFYLLPIRTHRRATGLVWQLVMLQSPLLVLPPTCRKHEISGSS